MRVLFVGTDDPSATSRHRADAFRRLGHVVHQLDPLRAFAQRLRGNLGRLHYHTGYSLLRSAVNEWLLAALSLQAPFDLCWVDSGEMLDSAAVESLRRRCGAVVLFNHDDPTGKRDWRRFTTLRSAISAYNLCVVVRTVNVNEFKNRGARKTVHVFRTYDEVAHAAPADGSEPEPALRSQVCFIGTNLKGEGRDRFLAALVERGLDLAIWGDRWDRSPLWDQLRPYVRGGSLAGRDYVDAIRGAAICLGFLAQRNRDEHTTRSMEIPFAGGVLCAQRTGEHAQLYREGVEALFWDGVDECHAACVKILADAPLRKSIRAAGARRVRENKVGNQDLIERVFAEL